MRKQILSLLAFLSLNLLASYAAAAVCVWLFPDILRNMSARQFLYFPTAFAAIFFWLSGFSINGHAPPDWAFLIAFLLAIASASVLFYRVKKVWFWIPFILFWVCLFQDVMAVAIIMALAPGLGALGAD